MDIILSVAIDDGFLSPEWNDILLSINFEDLELNEGKYFPVHNLFLTTVPAQKLLRTVSSRMPLRNELMSGMIQLGRNIMLNISTVIARISEENDPALIFTTDGKVTPSSLWNDIQAFFAAALQPVTDEDFISDTNFSLALHLLGDLLGQVCPTLINRIWYFYREVLAPLTHRFHVHRMSFVEFPVDFLDHSILQAFLISLPWENAVFHCRDRYLFHDMVKSVFEDPSVTCIIVSRLNWDQFVEEYANKVQQIAENPEEGVQTEISLLQWVKLMLSVHILNPRQITLDILSKVNYWPQLELNYFQEVFDGNSFLPLLTDGANRIRF